MKTFVPFKRIFGLLTAFVLSASTLFAQTSSASGNVLTDGLNFTDPQLIAGKDLEIGATYLFKDVKKDIDATVTIDSLVNGATVNKIDDNSNGTGYVSAFQPVVKSGGIVGKSYAVFSIRFLEAGTSRAVNLNEVSVTALDIDGNQQLKEFAGIDMGNGGTAKYMGTTTDLSLTQVYQGDFMGENILGVERNNIDTAAMENMYTASNKNISSLKVKYGATTLNTAKSARQYSLYMKGFIYPNQLTLPVDLLSFSAILTHTQVALSWITTHEENVSHFEVEKSLDGGNYHQIGMVFSYGAEGQESSYSFNDQVNASQSGIIYYRIKAVDNDGKYKYSDTRLIRTGKQEETVKLVTYPNPVTSQLRITLPGDWQGKAVVFELFNMNGQVMTLWKNSFAGQTETVDLSRLQRGTYLVRVSTNGQTTQQRIIKN